MSLRPTCRVSRQALLSGAVCTVASLSSVPVWAQSSVTLYGLVDAGVGFVNNVAGGKQYLATTSIMQANRLGFKGAEDLGGGTRAIFTLENGFSATNGAFGQGGALFGRQAFAGLSNNRWGTVTAGNQYDFMGATLGMYESSTWLLGQYSDHPFANDRTNSLRIPNSVEYLSPVLSGVQLGALYGFSNEAGNAAGAGQSFSYSASYNLGNFNVAAAYTQIKGNTLDLSGITASRSGTNVAGGNYMRTMGGAASYQFSKLFVYAMYTQALYTGLQGSGKANVFFRNYQVGEIYRLRPDVALNAGYTFTTEGAVKFHQVNTSIDYLFSKATDVYLIVQGEHAAGPNAHADMIGVGASSTANQIAAIVGIRHKF